MKAFACHWKDGFSLCFASSIAEASYKFDSLGQPLKIWEICLSDVIFHKIKFNEGDIECKISKYNLGGSIKIKKSHSKEDVYKKMMKYYINKPL